MGVNEIFSNHASIKLLKMDCEGSEYEIFLDISKANFSKVDIFYVEVHPTKKYVVSDFKDIMKEKRRPFSKKEVAHGCFEYVCSRLI
jgi:hypothetical protein